MAKSSILGGERAPVQPSGKGSDLLGPSDSSDSGSDAMGEFSAEQLNSDTDRFGTGERASVDPDESGASTDILPDRVAGPSGQTRADTADALSTAELAADEEPDEDDAALA